MATKTDPKPAGVAASDIKQAGKTYEGLSRQQLTEAYRIMYTARRLDDREIMLKRQQKIFFQISGAGHEAIGVAAAFALKAGYDWFYPYYRDRALCLGLGVSPYDMLLQAVGAADDPSSGGRQMPSHWSISRLVTGFPDFHFEEVDGTDPVASYAAFMRSVQHCRAGRGPAFIHAHVIRPYSHSLSDDERLYRPDVERQRDAARDPITRMQMFLLREGILDETGINKLEKQVDDDLQAVIDRALHSAPPVPETVTRFVYSPDLDPTSSAFETQPAPAKAEPTPTDGKKLAAKTMADLINATLRDEMKRDERIVIFGEDVADCSREQYLQQKMVKGKGGVFKLTFGLQCDFGSDRVFNSPLAEAAIVGRATGMATRGLKPVVEIQFFDYIWPAMMQLRNELPLIRWRSNNGFSAPCVIRVAIGGYLTGGAIYHSQCGESIFTHIPGLRVVFPSNALDAAGLLRIAIRCVYHVLFL